MNIFLQDTKDCAAVIVQDLDTENLLCIPGVDSSYNHKAAVRGGQKDWNREKVVWQLKQLLEHRSKEPARIVASGRGKE